MKYVAIITAILMLAAALCGCSASLVKLTDSVEAEVAEGAEAAEESEVAEEPEPTEEPEVAEEPEPIAEATVSVVFIWRNHPLSIAYVAFDDDFVTQDSPSGRWVRVLFESVTGEVTMSDVIEYSTELSLIDADGNEYTSNLIGNIVADFDMETGISTAETQEQFSIIYDLPADTDLDELSIGLNGDSLPLGGLPHEIPPAETE